ncbi:hypothetical protein ACFXNW_27300 [Nocardia sp. NPDC059180]|uniref:hypothetical protein n=1 Tax=Nocardia sp. NPDC059180 TaxID=3346761 RepID=UPI003676219C
MGELNEPFPGSWAVRAGLITTWELRNNYSRVHPDVYVPKGIRLDARGRALAAGHWTKGEGILAGCSAAAMYGTRWLNDRPAEIVMPRRMRPLPNVRVYRDRIPDDQVCEIAGFRCTTPARTAIDLARRLDFDNAVEVIDALCHATRTQPAIVCDLLSRLPPVPGSAKARALLPFIDAGAEVTARNPDQTAVGPLRTAGARNSDQRQT